MTALRVLIVDDNPLNVELSSYILSADGFQVDVATDASEALDRIGVHRPDVILMDIQLPGMDGLVLTQLLKAEPATRAIVVIAFTAYAMKGDEAKLRAAGCDGYLSKPIEVSTFAASVRALALGSPFAPD